MSNDPSLIDWLTAAGVGALLLFSAFLASILSGINQRLQAHGFMLRAIIHKEDRELANLDALTAAVATVQSEFNKVDAEIAEVVTILTAAGNDEEKIAAATSALTEIATRLTSDDSALAQAIDAANPATPGGVNDGG